MRRGEIWTVAGDKHYARKPHPVVIVQDDRFSATASVTICPFTTDPTDAPLLRVAVAPSEVNGLAAASRLMVDKVTTVARARLGKRTGRLGDEDMTRLDRAILVFLGLAG